MNINIDSIKYKINKIFNICKNICAIIGLFVIIGLFASIANVSKSNDTKPFESPTPLNESINVIEAESLTPTPFLTPASTQEKNIEIINSDLQITNTLINEAETLNQVTEDNINEYNNLTIPTLDEIPSYDNKPYVEINNNKATFDTTLISNTSWENYYGLDDLGRCIMCIASIGQDIMPTEERDNISSIIPTGWVQVKYNNTYLYNRCHLIGYQLTAENANEYNLITGTEYLNMVGMLPFENQIANYIKQTNNHVLYQVIPIFIDNELVCRGVWMQAYSEEDDGAGINFNIYCFNIQPEIEINYLTGESQLKIKEEQETKVPVHIYILNTNSKKIHTEYCSSVGQMSEKNKQAYEGTIDKLLNMGYEPCKKCNPS